MSLTADARPRVQLVVAAATEVGESPVWSPRNGGTLFWIDLPTGSVHETSPATGQTSTLRLPTHLGAVAPDDTGGLVVAHRTGIATLRDGKFEHRATFLAPGERMNDAKCDPSGRLWAGSTAMDFRPGAGALLLIQGDWSVTTVLEGLTLPNGLDWSPDGRTFYLADTHRWVIHAFDFDPESGALDNRRDFARFEGAGMPDGLCVDSEGGLWVALWGGGQVVHLDPDGRQMAAVDLAVVQPSSCCFGGPDLDVLFVTSAREGLTLPPDSADGSVFAVHGLGVTGRPASLFRSAGDPR